MNKRFLKFKYAAIRRYGEKRWTASNGVIEFNPNYTVGVSSFERESLEQRTIYPISSSYPTAQSFVFPA